MGYHVKKKEINLNSNTVLNFILRESSILTEEVVVKGVRASAETPTTYKVVKKEEITRNNNGKDLPFMLNLLPSVVVTSDAGNGVGYTGLRIRGSDSKKINVTIKDTSSSVTRLADESFICPPHTIPDGTNLNNRRT